VAIDGSPAAITALPTAQTIARQLNAAVEAVHVASEEMPVDKLRASLGLDQVDEEDAALRLLVGDPVEELLRAAADRHVVFIVLATHGHNVGAGPGLAPVPEALAAYAKRPTLLIRPEAAAALGGPPYPFKRMLLPFDGTRATASALKPALKLAGELGAAIDLLYVVHPGQAPPGEPDSIVPPLYVDEPYYEWPGWASEVGSWLRSCCGDVGEDVPIDVYIRAGSGRGEIGTAIAEFAAEQEADAIVLVRRSHLETGRAPILRAVLALTPCPVLLVAGKPSRVRRQVAGPP
jgi:nucleotide-binding universal stress UspA family protein